jgi:hypothetical protein
MNVFLDLEETVITSWADGMLLHTTPVREFLQQNNVKKVHIFSFAIWNKKDQDDFDRRFKSTLEKVLKVNIAARPSVEDMMRADTLMTGLQFDSITDFVSIRGKTGAFQNFCRFHFDHQVNVLIDDVVPNASFTNDDTGLVCEFINVNSLLT